MLVPAPNKIPHATTLLCVENVYMEVNMQPFSEVKSHRDTIHAFTRHRTIHMNLKLLFEGSKKVT